MTKKLELREQIAELQRQNEALVTTNDTLESWRASWLNGYSSTDQVKLQTTHNAFTELLQKLGVDNMTMAVYRIEALLKNEHADKAILAVTQGKAAAEQSVRVHQLAIRQLEFQRDSAQKREFDTGFDLGNTKARCGELEELLRELLGGMQCRATRSTEELIKVITLVLGDEK